MGGPGWDGIIDLADHVLVEVVGYQGAGDRRIGVAPVDGIPQADCPIRGNREGDERWSNGRARMMQASPYQPPDADQQKYYGQTLPAHGPLAIAVGEVEFGHGMILSENRSTYVAERRNEHFRLHHSWGACDRRGLPPPQFL